MADRNPKGNARRDLVLPAKSTTRPNAGKGTRRRPSTEEV